MLAIPILLWVGMPLHQAVVIVTVCSCVQATSGAVHLRDHVPWRFTFWAVGLRMIAVVAGIALLRKLVGMRVADVRFIVGCVLCVVVVLQMVLRPKPAERLHPVWAALAFPASGLLAGSVGMGGPPLAVWAVAHDWPPAKIRGFMFSTFALGIPPQLVLLGFVFGSVAWWSCLVGLLLSPLSILGSLIGLRIGHRLSQRVLRAVVFVMLLLIGLNAMIPKLFGGDM